eukprot:GHRQ01036461.1.p1 GENE.GHRQ01036461.1~~GHRQ01036461.1.p1  ORF type:complete len:110 (-),score=28.54 GHRQ01036461.1:208-537(-)
MQNTASVVCCVQSCVLSSAQACLCSVPPPCCRDVSVSGHDLQSLLFSYLDELLFIYSTEHIMMKFIAVTSLDTVNFTLTATGWVLLELINIFTHACMSLCMHGRNSQHP